MPSYEMNPEVKTMGSLNVPRDPRVIATLKDGKQIIEDVSKMSVPKFRAYLQRLLERTDLTDESRKQIEMALSTPE